MSLSSLLTSRYGQNNAPSIEPSELKPADVLEQLLSHRSVRAFLPDLLPEQTIQLLVAAAQSAATSSNMQAWSVIIIQDAERKAVLSKLAGDQPHMREAPVLMVWLADLSRYDRLAKRLGKEIKAVPYLESFLVACIDATLAAQNVAVAAESLGLGTVYIGGIRNEVEKVAEVLHLPPLVFPVFGLVIGKPDPARPAAIKPRLGQEAVVFYEKYHYDADREEAAITAYDEALKAFQRSEGMREDAWSHRVLSRLRGEAALHGRERLNEILHARGFELK